MRVFLSEYVTSGAWDQGEPPVSLLREGAAMLCALAADFARLPDCRVLTTWDNRWGPCPLALAKIPADQIEIHGIAPDDHESRVFDDLCRSADATLVIAPEFDGLLAERCRRVNELKTASLNCSVEAIRRCTDKLKLAEDFQQHHVPTIPTWELIENDLPSGLEFPIVIKPRDGAGSLDTYLIANTAQWGQFQKTRGSLRDRQWIVQPYVEGQTLSVAALVGNQAGDEEPALEVFPVAEQQLSPDGRFGYLGGRIPKTISLRHGVEQTLRKLVRLLPGLFGYVGFDLLLPRDEPDTALVVEINPRLTTSYLGYSALADGNLAGYLLADGQPKPPLRWKPQTVRFTAAGTITWSR